MASRIPDSFIQDLLARTDIVELIGSRVELKRAGKEYKGLSPFTHEKSASFFVSPAKQMFFDFSSGKNGTALSFLMEFDRLSFVEAVEEMAKLAGVEVPREGGNAVNRVVMEGPLDALAAAERFFREQLRTAQPAVDYLKKRGLSGATAKSFGIGYAPESWDALTRFFPQPQHAVTAGLLIEKDNGSCYDRFRNRIMFPIRDTRGRVIGFGGRTLGNDPAKYLNSPETPLFHKGRNLFGLYEAKQSSKADLPSLLVVEGYMDVVMLAHHGIQNAVATLGTATTRDHLTLLFKNTSRVVFCFDGDRAGRSAAWRALEQALAEIHEGRECRFMFLPDGHDPDSLVQEIGADAFNALVADAIPLPNFLLGELAKQVNLQTLDGRARLVSLAKPHLAKMRQGPLRDLIVAELEKLSRMARADLDAGLRENPIGGSTEPPPVTTPIQSLAKPVRDALRCLLEHPELAMSVRDLELLATADLPGAPLLVQVAEYFQTHDGAHAGQLLELWRGRDEAAVLMRVAVDSHDAIGDPAETLLAACAHLRQRAARVRAAELLQLASERPLKSAETAELKSLSEQLARRAPI